MAATYSGRTPTADEPDPSRADFYVGHGERAEYIGSVPYLGNLDELLASGRFAQDAALIDHPDLPYGEPEYRTDVATSVRETGGSTEWPHAYADSTGSPWAYCLIGGHTVQVLRWGRLSGVLYPRWHRDRERPRRSTPFPTMREVTESDDNAAG